MNDQERIDGLLRHINFVRENCSILSEKLINTGRCDLARTLIHNAQIHDASKFNGIEWEFLTIGNTTNKSGLKYAVEHHENTNPHHPRYWKGIENMPEIYLMEMVCDWKARSTEFATDLRYYIDNDAIKRFKFIKDGPLYQKIMGYVDMLCPAPFEAIPDTAEPTSVISIAS